LVFAVLKASQAGTTIGILLPQPMKEDVQNVQYKQPEKCKHEWGRLKECAILIEMLAAEIHFFVGTVTETAPTAFDVLTMIVIPNGEEYKQFHVLHFLLWYKTSNFKRIKQTLGQQRSGGMDWMSLRN
jgi:hypothetical protein